jgi:hypothetical protein
MMPYAGPSHRCSSRATPASGTPHVAPARRICEPDNSELPASPGVNRLSSSTWCGFIVNVIYVAEATSVSIQSAASGNIPCTVR